MAPFQSAWALLGLLAAGEVESPVVRTGVRYLQRQQQKSGLWTDPRFTAPGFPRVFYLKYHGILRVLPAVGARRLSQSRGSHSPEVSVTGIVAALTAEARTLGQVPAPACRFRRSGHQYPRHPPTARDQRHGSEGRGRARPRPWWPPVPTVC